MSNTNNDPRSFLSFMIEQNQHVHLFSIHSQQGAPHTFIIDKNSLNDGISWIEEEQRQKRNIYWQVNTSSKDLTKKAAKGDIVTLTATWVDIDPTPDLPRDAARRQIQEKLEFLEDRDAKPHLIIDSGNGFQCIWFTVKEKATPDSVQFAEKTNKELAEILRGDRAATDVCRILRFPGTINFPGPAKQKRGYTIQSASILHIDKLQPPLTKEEIKTLLSRLSCPPNPGRKSYAFLSPHPGPKCNPSPHSEGNILSYERTQPSEHNQSYNRACLESVISHLQNNAKNQEYSDWQRAGANLKGCVKEGHLSDKSALELFQNFSQHNYPNYDADNVSRRWATIGGDAAGAGLGGLINFAKETGWTPPRLTMKPSDPAEIDAILAQGQNNSPQQERLPENIKAKLQKTANGTPISNVNNALTVARNTPTLKDIFHFDMMNQQCEIREEISNKWHPVTSEDETHIQCRLQSLGLTGLIVQTTRQTIEKICKENSFHPLHDWLNTLQWDGKERVSSWLSTYLGTEDTPYTRGIGLCFLIGMIARIMEPGCKMETMLILEGKQGTGKSRACAILAGKYFGDHLPNLSDKKKIGEYLLGKWLVEASELEVMRKKESTELKAFLSTQTDDFRAAYARRNVKIPRQCVFIGTTNQSEYLRDETGARRYFPVKTGVIDTKALAQDREQLFAEALHLFKQGEKWWPSPELQHMANQETEKRYESDLWDEPIKEWLDRQETSSSSYPPSFSNERRNSPPRLITSTRILTEALSMPHERQDQRAKRRVNGIMKRLGYEQNRNGKERFWRKDQPPLP
ncbi:hypothetical protein GS501_06545 [Saccharibacter sp. 17.LH.SD]|uniref:VapE domain-containing protein n=1 Tax=Saccharibacter sp. 17.LH.SD TaxID=2689393 RepID=UPI00137062F1|nr:VapE domain-containing protein [Saccharibacter sp. 17.LH.SD]MXV44701.1 hypothetical protein [Saccharibacter sp. 17.LH.SD]